MTGDRHISYDDLALHTMHALSPEESAAVRLHLADCAECREQLAEISGDLALVALSVEQQSLPEGARQRLIDRIAASASPPKEPAGARVVPIAREKKSALSWTWIPWAAVAALLILCANLFVRVKILDDQLAVNEALMKASREQNRRAHALLDALNAPNAQRVTLTTGKTPPAPTARAIYLASRGTLLLQASNLQALPPNKTYELWIIPTSGAPIPAGLFRPDAGGSGSVVLPSIPAGVQAKAFGITIENEGGSNTPTLPTVLSGAAAGE